MFDELPDSLGPHFSASEPHALAVAVADPLRWAIRNALPFRHSDEKVHGSRGQQRSTIGYQFFRQRKIARYVKKTFEPVKDISSGAQFEALHSISHYVRGDGKLLLMEPLIPVRTGAKKELGAITNLLWSYQGSLVPFLTENGINTELVVYMLQGGEPALRNEFRASAAAAAHRVIDINQVQEAADFAEEIRSVGSSGYGQNDLIPA
jgi:hypothetical protein